MMLTADHSKSPLQRQESYETVIVQDSDEDGVSLPYSDNNTLQRLSSNDSEDVATVNYLDDDDDDDDNQDEEIENVGFVEYSLDPIQQQQQQQHSTSINRPDYNYYQNQPLPKTPEATTSPQQQLLYQQKLVQSSYGVHKPGNMASLLSYEDTLDMYRRNAKKSNDPHTQLEFAKYLIQISESLPIESQQSVLMRQKLLKEGIKWVKRLSSTGLGLGKPAYPEAQFFLAECYGNGIFGLKINHDRAFALYVQASKQNHAGATYRAAVCYEIGAGTRKDHARAGQFYRKAAALGDTGAMYKMGVMLLNGTMNTSKNEREAVTWLKRAAAVADENHPEALHDLAVIYEKGGIPSVIADEKYARELYTKAAQLGYAPSQLKLGYCFEYGTLTCEVDPRRSIAWYTRAAEQGHPEAELALSGWYLTGAEGILEQNDLEAYLWARKSAEKSFAKAEYAVGYYSEVGIGTAADITDAIVWYTKAANGGNERAKQRLVDIKNHNMAMRRMNGVQRTPSDCVIC